LKRIRFLRNRNALQNYLAHIPSARITETRYAGGRRSRGAADRREQRNRDGERQRDAEHERPDARSPPSRQGEMSQLP